MGRWWTSARVGAWGERLVCARLQLCGYRVAHRNWHCARGELDLVVWHKDVLCFVEVKSRLRRGERRPGAALTWEKRKRLVRAARHYIYVFQPTYRCIQFGLAEVTLMPVPEVSLNLDAFRADDVWK